VAIGIITKTTQKYIRQTQVRTTLRKTHNQGTMSSGPLRVLTDTLSTHEYLHYPSMKWQYRY